MWGSSPESDRGYEIAKGYHRYFGDLMAWGCLIFFIVPALIGGAAFVAFIWWSAMATQS